MQVALVTHTPNPEQLVAAAAKVCYSSLLPEDILSRLTDSPESAGQYIEMLRELGHESPFEHISFTFCASGVSRSLLAQLTRHRIASYSVRSQRYVGEQAFEVVMPDSIKNDPEASKIFSETIEACREGYRKVGKILAEKLIAGNHIDRENKTAMAAVQKQADEDARFLLPNACETRLFFTMNARSLFNFFNQRCCNRAQWEIRELAQRMLVLVKDAAPHVFAKSGPQCLCGNCPEGKMSCGKINEMRKFYSELGVKDNG